MNLKYVSVIVINVLYAMQPAKRHAYAQSGDNIFTPVERELVFDIVRHWAYRKLSILVFFFPNEYTNTMAMLFDMFKFHFFLPPGYN